MRDAGRNIPCGCAVFCFWVDNLQAEDLCSKRRRRRTGNANGVKRCILTHTKAARTSAELEPCPTRFWWPPDARVRTSPNHWLGRTVNSRRRSQRPTAAHHHGRIAKAHKRCPQGPRPHDVRRALAPRDRYTRNMNTVVRPPCPELREPCTRRMPCASARLAHTRFWLGPRSGTRC